MLLLLPMLLLAPLKVSLKLCTSAAAAAAAAGKGAALPGLLPCCQQRQLLQPKHLLPPGPPALSEKRPHPMTHLRHMVQPI
jgi:hypothetical protein